MWPHRQLGLFRFKSQLPLFYPLGKINAPVVVGRLGYRLQQRKLGLREEIPYQCKQEDQGGFRNRLHLPALLAVRLPGGGPAAGHRWGVEGP